MPAAMSLFSDSLLTPNATAASSMPSASTPLTDAERRRGDGGAASGRGAGGFASVLGRLQQERASTDERETTESGESGSDAGTQGIPAQALAQEAVEPQGERETPGAAAPESGQGALGRRQELAAAFAVQWAALMRAESDVGSQASEASGAPPGGKAEVTFPATEASGSTTVMEADGGATAEGAASISTMDPGWMGAAWVVLPSGMVQMVSAAGEGGAPDAGAAEGAGEIRSVGGTATGTEMPSVVALRISPQLEVITAPAASAGSDRALLSFAAEQGFDTQALRRIFGDEALGAASPSRTDSAGTALANQGSGVGVTGSGLASSQGGTASSQTALGLPPALGGGTSAGISSSSIHPGAPGLAVGAGGPAGSASAMASAVASSLLSGAASTPAWGASLEGWRADGGRMTARRVASDGGPSSQDLGKGLATGASQASTWAALQGRLGVDGLSAAGSSMGSPVNASGAAAFMPAPGLPTLAGVGLGQALGITAEAGTRAASSDLAPLAIESGATDAVSTGTHPLQGLTESGTTTARSEAGSRVIDPTPVDLRAHHESDHEALTKRLGEALAAKMLAQIEKGEWQIRLSVAPQHLGPIDIDLQMKGQRLEAQFQVANGSTQAMIQDGLPRLREAVGASGMDLASVWVSGGLSDRNRGNPTPGQPDDPAPEALKEGVGDEQAVNGTPSVDARGPGWVPRPGAVDILI